MRQRVDNLGLTSGTQIQLTLEHKADFSIKISPETFLFHRGNDIEEKGEHWPTTFESRPVIYF